MVRNVSGGTSHKRFAKKHADTAPRALRRAGPGESYGVVCEMSGGQHCKVVDEAGIKATCVIRKKFRGRGKRDNTIAVGTWVLVAPREYETAPQEGGRAPKCDLLEVYSSLEREKLMSDPGDADFSELTAARRMAAGEVESDPEIEFFDDCSDLDIDSI